MQLELSGNSGEAGCLLLTMDGQKPQVVELSPKLWAFMEVLIRAAMYTQVEGVHWLTSSVKTVEIVATLERKGVLLDGTPEDVHRIAYNLRKVLTTYRITEWDPYGLSSNKAFSKQLVISSRGRGYRLGISPDRLSLYVNGAYYRPQQESA